MAHTNLGKTQNSGLLYTEINKCLAVDASDNVGIGTTSPDDRLHIYGTDDQLIKIESTTGASRIYMHSDRTEAGGEVGNVRAVWGGTDISDIRFLSGDDTTNKDNGEIAIRVSATGTLTEVVRINSTGNVGIGTPTPSANADITLEGGALCIKETTTPTADTNYGKIYTKNDNKLYFQDGAGAEHEIAFV